MRTGPPTSFHFTMSLASALTIGVSVLLAAICVAQDRVVTFKVVAPSATPKGSKVFIAGNHSLLGDWNPGLVMLKQANDSVWTAKFTFAKGDQLEYKITRGTWNSQAIYDDGKIPGNSNLVVQRDTEIVIEPKSWSDIEFRSNGGITGFVTYHRGLVGEGLKYSRDLIVWLPPSYANEPARRFPVLYMHDGQNIIDPNTSYAGFDWRVDEVADSLIRAGKIQEIIVVGIYNSPDRIVEYSDSDLGRKYADFVVHTVKPLIDSTYRTMPDRNNTAVMGSSLGGLVSFLFAWWYPDVFSKAGCLSSVFSYNDGKLLREVRNETGKTRDIRIYMDCGGFAGESTLKPGMDTMVSLLKEKGYRENVDFQAFYDAVAEHNERAWAVRVWRPLLFMFSSLK